jgi:hypothetical protein
LQKSVPFPEEVTGSADHFYAEVIFCAVSSMMVVFVSALRMGFPYMPTVNAG